MVREFCAAVSGSGELRTLLCGAYLAVCAAQDFRSRKISLCMSVTAGGAAILLDTAAFICGRGTVLPYAAGLIPGLLLLLLAFFAKGAAGQGDGICFLTLGAFLGSPTVWIILMAALFLASLTGITLMLFRKAGRKTRLPFLTFAAAAWAALTVVSLTGINL